MKILLSLASAALLLIGIPATTAAPAIPSLVGKWSVKSEGAIMIHGKDVGSFTHWAKGQKTLVGELEITAQDGRVLHGSFKTKKGAEPFLAVIGFDNRLYLADDDGFLDGRIVNRNKIEVVYRHVTAKDTVAAVGIWTRKK